MPNNNNFIDGTGKFQQSTENAGVITYGEFSQTAINTGSIAVSAIFTGSSVNSGSIGNYMPFNTATIVQANSANWNAAYDAMSSYVQDSDARLSDAREPLAHTQAISTIDGLDAVLATLEAGQGSLPVIASTDIIDFTSAVDALIPVTSVAGKTGAVSLETADLSDFSAAVENIASTVVADALSAADIAGTAIIYATGVVNTAAGSSLATLVNGTVPASQLPSYVDDVLEYSDQSSFPVTGETGKIYVDTTAKKIYRWSGSAYVEIAASPGSTDSVTEGTSNLYYTSARAASAAPVQSVAGKTGAVTLGTADITGLQTALDSKQAAGSYAAASHTHSTSDITDFNTAASAAAPVQSVAGRTGAVLLSAADISGLSAAVIAYAPAAPAQLVQSVAGKTGAVTLTVLDVASAAPLSALPSAASTSNWDATYSTVKNTSASWTTNVNVMSAGWQQAYTNVNSNSASWSSTNFGAISATSVSLSSAMLSTYSTPVTASGDFIVVTVGNKQRLIRIWDFK